MHVGCEQQVERDAKPSLHTSPRTKTQRTKKASKQTKSSSPRATKQGHAFYDSYSADGETFAIHTDAYVVVDESLNVEAMWNETTATCQVCQRSSRGSTVLLECDRCLLGYHASCVGLDTVPKV